MSKILDLVTFYVRIESDWLWISAGKQKYFPANLKHK